MPPLPAIAALASLLAFGGCSALERSLIFPGTATQGRADAIVPASSAYELVPLTTSDGTHIVAQFGRALTPAGVPRSDAATRPTVIYFYGNGACLAYSREQFDGFRRLGFNVIVPEFPGYGMSAGTASEAAFYAAADAAYDHLLTRTDLDPTRIVAVGWSLGAAVAIDLASRRPIARLITISAFTSMAAVAKEAAPWAPTSLIIRSRFDNVAKIPAVVCPILLVHGPLDTLVPHAMAAELAAKATAHDVRRHDVTAAGHNDLFYLGGPALWHVFADFLSPPENER